MDAQTVEDRDNCRPCFAIGRGASHWIGNRRKAGTDHLQPSNLELCCLDCSDLPGRPVISRSLPGHLVECAHPGNRREESPAACPISSHRLGVASPHPGWGGANNMALPVDRTGGGRIATNALRRRRYGHVDQPQRFIVENLLLDLAGNP
jgi:hypothetical protein